MKKYFCCPDSKPFETSTGASSDGESTVIVVVDTDGEYIDTTTLSSKLKYPAMIMRQHFTQRLHNRIR